MKHGRIVEHGTYQELLARGVDFHAEVEEAQARQVSEAAADMSDSGQPGTDPVQGSPAAANGVISNGRARASTGAAAKAAEQPANRRSGGEGSETGCKAAS